jgi:ketosteroid isomerase-like protein
MDARETVEAYFKALTDGDAESLLALINSADHFVKIGTDEDECVEGGSGVADYYRHHVASTRNFTIETQHLNVHERDTAAWFYTRQIWTLEWQGRPEVLAMRLTGVLEKESENWKFVQIHASLGQPVAQG